MQGPWGLSQSNEFQCIPCLQQFQFPVLLEHAAVFFPSLLKLSCICSLSNPPGLCCTLLVCCLLFPTSYPRACFSLLISAPPVALQDVTTPAQGRGSHLGLGHRDVNQTFFLPPALQVFSRAEHTNHTDAIHLGNTSLTLSFHTTTKQALGIFC